MQCGGEGQKWVIFERFSGNRPDVGLLCRYRPISLSNRYSPFGREMAKAGNEGRSASEPISLRTAIPIIKMAS